MRRLLTFLCATAVTLLLTVPAVGTTYINSDFQSGTTGWDTSPGFARYDSGGGAYVFGDSAGASTQSINSTQLPAQIQVDMDFKRTAAGTMGAYYGFFFQLKNLLQINASQAYSVRYSYGYQGTNALTLVRKTVDWGQEDTLGTGNVPADDSQHHIRITDDGTGIIKVYWDNMVTPVINVNDQAGYVGGPNHYVGVAGWGNVDGWVDNVVVASGDSTAPAAVTNLACSSPTASTINLAWTAPGDDGSTGTAASYDVRYSTSTINDANWASATQVTGEPTPLVAGTNQSMTVPGLSGDTTYYFAMKTSDEVPNVSAISNCPSGTTSDTVAPAAVTNLATSNPTTSSITLSWTAPGDNGSTGTAATYDIRYSTSVITTGNWASATQVTGEPAPAAAGTNQNVIVSGLNPGTTYYFAMETADEVPNWSSLSNVPSGTTLTAGDTTAPAAVTNLATGSPTSNSITLTWTAPGDDGNTGTATSYDIRYSTSAINDANWASATQATGEPAPAVAGTNQNMVVGGLNASTTYYFAMKTSDEVPNVSGISNCPSGTTTSGGSGGPLISSDFQTNTTGWDTSGGFNRFDSGGGAYVFGDSGGVSSQSDNSTALPSAIRIDMDFKRTAAGSSGCFMFVFHMSSPGQINAVRAYRLQYAAGSGSSNGLSLIKKVQDWGQELNLGTGNVPCDNNQHHVRITDDGTGMINIYWDNMTTPVIFVDDRAQYIGAGNTYMGLSGWGDVDGWVDNVVVMGPGAPDAVTNLAASATDWFKVHLTWSAPQGEPVGSAASYDIRYSTSTINDANWAGATQVTGEPTPAAPGTAEAFDVTGLSASTTYYFAIKSANGGGQISNLSNVPSATTLSMDGSAPAAVTNLASANVGPNRVTLSWTAVGDNGTTGTASVYDVRYSTSTINAGNWGSATQATGEPTPKASGSAETFVLSGLTANTTYYVAMKVGDEVPNWSGLSNVISFMTLPADTTAPAAISDLRVAGTHIRAAYLTWTAPTDSGGAGTGSYDIRYSTSTITAGNWSSATPCTGVPTPAAPGTIEHFTVGNLNSSTTYYFAIKTSDLAIPANTSAISNCPSGTTLAPVAAVTVHNPWITNDRVADCRTLAAMGTTFQKAYTPNGVVNPANNEDKVTNEYNNFKRRLYHWGQMPPDNRDVVEQLNVYGWALCGSQAAMNATVLYQMGIAPRTISIASGGHTIWEANYDGAWHCQDTMCTFYVYNRAVPRKIASAAEMKTDHTLILNAVSEGRACPGFLLCGDTPSYFATGMDTWSVVGDPGTNPTTWSMNMDLRMGESISRTWESWANQYTNQTSTPPYHHEANNDWKDTVNIPYWEPYALTTAQSQAIGISLVPTYRRWANGTFVLAPDFRSAGYQANVYSSANIRTFNDDGLTPDLHVNALGTPTEVVFKITAPYLITDATVDATFYRHDAGDLNEISVSTNGSTYINVWGGGVGYGTTQLTGLSLRNQVTNTYTYYVKVQLQADGGQTDAGCSGLKITTIFEHNKGGMAYLDKGANNISVTLDNPQDLASGATFKVTYQWKEYDGSDWTISRNQSRTVTASPTNFTITTGGAKVPRTEYILMELVAPPVPDVTEPAPIATLAVGAVASGQVTLNWTATGDDWDQGTAAAYDLRYSTSPITGANFSSATQAGGVPAPKAAGNAETFNVTGLSNGTLYYFAIKARDEVPNWSQISNVVSGTPTGGGDTTAPGQITNLAAVPSATVNAVDLTWTATGDDGSTGTATTYDIRYSTSAINSGNWASATQCTGEPTPHASGYAESWTVTGLTGGTTYYFAIKAIDEAANAGVVSNSPGSRATKIGLVTLQDGLSGYAGTRDNYMNAGAATTNYGNSTKMNICGYADQGLTNRQRPLLRFDLSSIAAGTTITNATLYVYAYDGSFIRGSTGYYGVYPLTRDWNETQSTWTIAATGVNWTTAGGDFNATADAQAAKQGVASVWYAFDVTSRVQGMINTPSGNYGWVIKCTDENLHNQDAFGSKTYSTQSYRPKLVVRDY